MFYSPPYGVFNIEPACRPTSAYNCVFIAVTNQQTSIKIYYYALRNFFKPKAYTHKKKLVKHTTK